MAYATEDDVEAALGRTLGDLDVTFLLETASDLVFGYLNTDPPAPIPGPIVRVVAEMVAAVINRPQNPPDPADDAYTVAGFNYRIGPQSVGPWLTGSQKERLDNWRVGVVNLECIGETTGSDVWNDVSTSFDPYAGTDLTSFGTVADV